MSTTPQGGPGILWGLGGLTGRNNQVTLAAGQSQVIPAGQYMVSPGPYTLLQHLDPIMGIWLTLDITAQAASYFITSDGANVRLANLTGCAIGALITNAGSAYTSAPAVAASAGGSTWKPIIGGAVNTTVTITTAGAGYNFAPQLIVQAPPPGGIPATMTCTISGGAINAVTVINQGAGYTSAPTITVVPDFREATATTPGPTTPAVLTAALTGTGTMTGLLCTNQGTALTSVPTLTFTGGGGSNAAATVIMCFTATGGTTAGITVSNGGAVYGNAQPFAIKGFGGITAGSAAYTNPMTQTGLLQVRQADWFGTSTAGGAVTATGLVATDTGLYQAVPNGAVLPSGTGALPTTTAIVAVSVGGVTDTSILQPII